MKQAFLSHMFIWPCKIKKLQRNVSPVNPGSASTGCEAADISTPDQQPFLPESV